MVSGTRDNSQINRLHLDRETVSGDETTRVGELSRLRRQGNPGRRDNFSSHKRCGSPNRDNARCGESHVMLEFRI